jgi:uncharacterized membrane protein (DUF485 family)
VVPDLPSAARTVADPNSDGLDEFSELDDLVAGDDPALQEVAEQTTYGEIVLGDLIRRQLALSLSVAGAFLLLLFGLPIFNLLFPQLGALPVLGLPLSWLLLAVLIYPILWVLALYYVTTSRTFEDEFTELVR